MAPIAAPYSSPNAVARLVLPELLPWPAGVPVQIHGMDGDEFFAEEGGDMLAGAGRPVVEQDDGMGFGISVHEEVSAFGLARPGIELGYRRLVGMQHGRGQ